jgi:RNA polymerase II subunit A C-terminal domain phosphatase SSU72
MEGRDSQTTPVHVINIDIQDNHEEATIGAFMICDLVALVNCLIYTNFPLNKMYF